MRWTPHVAVVGVLAIGFVLAGCGSTARPSVPRAELAVTITRGVVHRTPTELTPGVYHFHLQCDPSAGLSIAEHVCRALRTTPSMLTAPTEHRYCLGGFPSPPSVDISGRVGGKRISLHEGGCDSAITVRRLVKLWMNAFGCTPNEASSQQRCADALPGPAGSTTNESSP